MQDPTTISEACVTLVQAPLMTPNFFLAGAMCSSMSHGLTVPIDVVKTRLQMDENLRNSGFFKALTSIVQKEGLMALTRGKQPHDIS